MTRVLTTIILCLTITACGVPPHTQLCPGGPLHTECAATP